MNNDNNIVEYNEINEASKEQVDRLGFDFIDDIDDEDQLYSNSNANYESDIKLNDVNQVSNNPIIANMLKSSDESTYNMGCLLFSIEKQCPAFLQEALNHLTNNIETKDGNIRYVHIFDMYTYCASSLLLCKLLRFEETSFLGKRLLADFINGKEDRDFEFYGYNALLKRHIGEKRQEKLNDLLNCLTTYYEMPSTREEALDNMRKLAILVETTGLAVTTGKGGVCCYMPGFNIIECDDVYMTESVLLHEFGHAMDNYFSPRDKTVKPVKEFNRAKQHIINNPRSIEIINRLNNRINDMIATAYATFNQAIIEKYGSIENGIRAFEDLVNEKVDEGKLKKLLKKYDVDSDTITDIMVDFKYGDITTYDIAKVLFEAARNNHVTRLIYFKEEGSILDIIAAIFGDRDININGQEIPLRMGHSKEYFDSVPDNSMTEIMANLNSLIVLGKTEMLEELKDLIGDEMWEYLMNERNAGRIMSNKNKEKEKKVA